MLYTRQFKYVNRPNSKWTTFSFRGVFEAQNTFDAMEKSMSFSKIVTQDKNYKQIRNSPSLLTLENEDPMRSYQMRVIMDHEV